MKRLLLVLLGLAITNPVIGQDSGAEVPFGLIIAEQARASFTLLGAGARAAGMGGAFTAVADDATALVTILTTKNKKDRYPTAEAFLQDVNRVLNAL